MTLTKTIGANASTVACLPPGPDHGGRQQDDDAGKHEAHDHPEGDEPWRGVVADGCGQGGVDADELQSFIGQQKGAVDAIPRPPVGKVQQKL